MSEGKVVIDQRVNKETRLRPCKALWVTEEDIGFNLNEIGVTDFFKEGSLWMLCLE